MADRWSHIGGKRHLPGCCGSRTRGECSRPRGATRRPRRFGECWGSSTRSSTRSRSSRAPSGGSLRTRPTGWPWGWRPRPGGGGRRRRQRPAAPSRPPRDPAGGRSGGLLAGEASGVLSVAVGAAHHYAAGLATVQAVPPEDLRPIPRGRRGPAITARGAPGQRRSSPSPPGPAPRGRGASGQGRAFGSRGGSGRAGPCSAASSGRVGAGRDRSAERAVSTTRSGA